MLNINYLTCRWCSKVRTGSGAGLHGVSESSVCRKLLQNPPSSQELHKQYLLLFYLLTRTVEPTPGGSTVSTACCVVWRGCSRGACSCMLMRRQYAKAARAADQTRACVSAAHRPTRPIDMTKKKRNSLKCHQSLQSQQNTTNRFGAPG